MAKISTELEAQLKSAPNQTVKLIVRTQGDAAPHLAWLASQGIKVTQQFRLTPGVAVTCFGGSALKLSGQEWVISVEIDQAVTTM